MKAKVKWLGQDGMAFVAESGSGHALVLDGSPEAGGRNLGPRPMEMVLMGFGGCSSFDVVLILKRSRQDIHDCVVEIDSERAESDPKVFTRIQSTLRFPYHLCTGRTWLGQPDLGINRLRFVSRHAKHRTAALFMLRAVGGKSTGR